MKETAHHGSGKTKRLLSPGLVCFVQCVSLVYDDQSDQIPTLGVCSRDQVRKE